MYFESRHIEQLLINLLDNACKFAPKAGTIAIRGGPFFWERRGSHSQIVIPKDRRRRSSRQPNSYRIDIQDSGMPIPPDHLERIFEEYVSYPNGADRDGAGLGLAICKMIVTQHEGRIWAENTSLGPVFSFVLPLFPVQATSLHGTKRKRISRGGSVSRMQISNNGRKILVGEDEPEVRGYFEMALKCLGYSVELAQDGNEVLSCLAIFQSRDLGRVAGCHDAEARRDGHAAGDPSSRTQPARDHGFRRRHPAPHRRTR